MKNETMQAGDEDAYFCDQCGKIIVTHESIMKSIMKSAKLIAACGKSMTGQQMTLLVGRILRGLVINHDKVCHGRPNVVPGE